MSNYPGLDKLDRLLAGEDAVVIRPPVPKINPNHDLYHPQPVKHTRNSWADILGEEHFDAPVDQPKPVVKRPARSLYTIGQLAKVLGRQPVTVRMWISKGYMPEANHWTNGPEGVRKRRYTHEQVMGMLSILSDLNMIENKRTQISNEFVVRVRTLWDSCA